MKNTMTNGIIQKMMTIALVAVIVLSFAACPTEADDDDNSGKLTVTGISEYDGKWIFAMGNSKTDETMIYAAANITISPPAVTGVKISGGKAELNVWEVRNGELFNFDKTGQYGVVLYIIKKATFTEDDFTAIFDKSDFSNVAGGAGETVNFTAGVGTLTSPSISPPPGP